MGRRIEWPTAAAMLLAPVGVVVACLCIPPGVDELPTSDRKMATTLDAVARHPFATRLGFLAFAVGMLGLPPAMAVLRSMHDTSPGRRLVEIGSRMVAVAACALAIGNSFAPATEPSAVRAGLPRDVMIDYLRHHLVNGWDWAIIAFYPLLPVGAVLLGVGLWRGQALSHVATLLVVAPLVVLVAPPLSPPFAVLGLALGTGFVLVLRDARLPAATGG